MTQQAQPSILIKRVKPKKPMTGSHGIKKTVRPALHTRCAGKRERQRTDADRKQENKSDAHDGIQGSPAVNPKQPPDKQGEQDGDADNKKEPSCKRSFHV